MTDGEVAALARGLGNVEKAVENLITRVEGLRLNVKEGQDATDKKVECLSQEIRMMKASDELLAAEQRTAEEMLAQQRAQRRSQVETAWTVLNHGLVRAIVAAGAAGAGFGLIAEVLR